MFNIFGRRAGLLRASAGYLSLIGAGELVTLAQLGYDSGLSLLWFPGGIAAGFLILGLFADRVRVRAAVFGVDSIVEYVRDFYGNFAATGLGLSYLLALGSLLILQFEVGGQLLQITTGLPAIVTPFLIAAVIIGYLLIGGYVAVLSTDVLRLAFLGGCAVLLAVTAILHTPTPTSNTLRALMPLSDGVMLFVLGLFGAVCAGDVWQTVLASRSKSVLLRSMLAAGASFLVFGFAIGMLGIAAKQIVPVLPPGKSALIVASNSVVPTAVTPVLALMIIGSVMATADTEIWVIAISVVSLRAGPPDQQARQVRVRRDVRVAIPIVAAIALGCSYLAGRAEAVYQGLLVLLTSLAPPIIGVIALHKARIAVGLSIWVALGLTLWLLVANEWTIPPSLTFAPVLGSLLAYGAGAIADRIAGAREATL